MEHKVILITGASSGFGKICAAMLSSHGHVVYGTSRKNISVPINNVKMLEMDVTQQGMVSNVVERIMAEQGHIDVLINNAGVGISGAIELASEQEILLQMGTNFMGVVNVCKAVLPYMRQARSGRIINISSIAGVIAVPFQGFYSASKFAIEGYSEALSVEVKPFGIKVCLVEPGDFSTNFTANRRVSELTVANEDYSQTFLQTMKIIEDAENNGSPPEKLGRAICKLVNCRNPRLRTKVGRFDQVVFAKCKCLLPSPIVQWVVRSFYKL